MNDQPTYQEEADASHADTDAPKRAWSAPTLRSIVAVSSTATGPMAPGGDGRTQS